MGVKEASPDKPSVIDGHSMISNRNEFSPSKMVNGEDEAEAAPNQYSSQHSTPQVMNQSEKSKRSPTQQSQVNDKSEPQHSRSAKSKDNNDLQLQEACLESP